MRIRRTGFKHEGVSLFDEVAEDGGARQGLTFEVGYRAGDVTGYKQIDQSCCRLCDFREVARVLQVEIEDVGGAVIDLPHESDEACIGGEASDPLRQVIDQADPHAPRLGRHRLVAVLFVKRVDKALH